MRSFGVSDPLFRQSSKQGKICLFVCLLLGRRLLGNNSSTDGQTAWHTCMSRIVEQGFWWQVAIESTPCKNAAFNTNLLYLNVILVMIFMHMTMLSNCKKLQDRCNRLWLKLFLQIIGPWITRIVLTIKFNPQSNFSAALSCLAPVDYGLFRDSFLSSEEEVTEVCIQSIVVFIV